MAFCLEWENRGRRQRSGYRDRTRGEPAAVELPVIWAAPGYGNLSCEQKSGDAAPAAGRFIATV